MKLPFFLLAVLFFFDSDVYAQNFWASQQGGQNVDETLSLDTDANGNTYATGYFSSAAQLSGELQTSSGLTDVFVSKTDPSGALLWSAKAGGSFSDRGLSVASDNAGNLIVCGFFTGEISFENGVSLVANGNSQDAFVAKYDPSGQVLWARAGGSIGNADRANGVAADGSGNIYITGQFSGEATFSGTTIVSSGSSIDVFTAKYDAFGNLSWIKTGTGIGTNTGLGIAVSASGETYVTGSFSESITFDNAYNNPIINALFLIKYSSAGSEVWFRYAGGSDQSASYAIAEHEGAVYITGDCGDALTFFNTNSFPVLNNNYDRAIFLAKFNGQGAYQWGRTYGSNSPLSARGIDCSNNKIVITGWFECTFDSLSNLFGERIFRSYGFRDIFLIAHNQNGERTYQHHLGGLKSDRGNDVSLPPDGFEILAGSYTTEIVLPYSTIDSNVPGVFSGSFLVQDYCSYPAYGGYQSIQNDYSDGLDGFIFRGFDPAGAPLDVFDFSNLGDCDYSLPPLQIYNFNLVGGDPSTVGDTIRTCYPDFLKVSHRLRKESFENAPYLLGWSSDISINSAFDAQVTIISESQDGCYTEHDTVWVIAPAPPSSPFVTDSWLVNDSTNNPIPLHICPGDSLILTAYSAPGLELSWQSGANYNPISNDSIHIYEQGTYSAYAVDTITGCSAETIINITKSLVPPETITPYLQFWGDDSLYTALDTAYFCADEPITVRVADSITNQSINPYTPPYFTVTRWINGGPAIVGGSEFSLNFSNSTWVYVETEIAYADTICFDNPELFYTADSIYVIPMPVPSPILQLSAPNLVCAGTTYPVVVVTNGNPSFNFDISSISGDTLFTSAIGSLSGTLSITNSFGCSESTSAYVTVLAVSTPEVITNPAEAVICPGETVTLSTNSLGTASWVGPFGPIATGPSIVVDSPGQYYAEVNFYEGCDLVSNTVQVSGYASPYITAWPPTLCLVGGQVTLSVIATNPTAISWLAPLSGNSAQQVITQPGVYGVQVTSCGILSEVFITIGYSESVVEITILDTLPTCFGGTIGLSATPGFIAYEWSNDNTGQVVNATQNGSITVAALDISGCYVVADSIDIYFEPIPPMPIISYDLPCFGDDILLSADPGFVHQWVYQSDTVLSANLLLQGVIQPETVSIILNSDYCAGPIGIFVVEPRAIPETPQGYSNSPVCTGQSINLIIENPDDAMVYYWQVPNGITLNGGGIQNYTMQTAADAGFYSLWAGLNGCNSDTTEIFIDAFETQQVVLPADTVLCSGIELEIIPSGGIFISYLWQDGSTAPTYTVSEPGIYLVFTEDLNSCTSFADMEINFVSCIVGIPNIFTPNGDGFNDLWLIDVYQPKSLLVTVFDRWGKTVYKSNGVSSGWDGENSNSQQPCATGQYYYVIEGTGYLDQDISSQGPLQLNR